MWLNTLSAVFTVHDFVVRVCVCGSLLTLRACAEKCVPALMRSPARLLNYAKLCRLALFFGQEFQRLSNNKVRTRTLHGMDHDTQRHFVREFQPVDGGVERGRVFGNFTERKRIFNDPIVHTQTRARVSHKSDERELCAQFRLLSNATTRVF